MKVYFATQNDHKVAEVQAVMKEFGIKVEKLGLEKDEMKESEIEQVATSNAETFARKHSLPVVVEDTGFFFHAYEHFPGSNPKLMFKLLGYKGLLKLLEGEQNRGAEFRTAVAFSENGETKLFTGKLAGSMTDKPEALEMDVMPYERIFIPEGHEKPLAYLPREEKNKISHRARAFRDLGAWLKQRQEQAKQQPKKEEKKPEQKQPEPKTVQEKKAEQKPAGQAEQGQQPHQPQQQANNPDGGAHQA